MKQAWCLAASSTDATAKQLTGLYGRRWGIEIHQAWRIQLYRVRRARHDDWRRPTTPWRGVARASLRAAIMASSACTNLNVVPWWRTARLRKRPSWTQLRGSIWHSEMPSQFGNRPLLGLTFNDHRSPLCPTIPTLLRRCLTFNAVNVSRRSGGRQPSWLRISAIAAWRFPARRSSAARAVSWW